MFDNLADFIDPLDEDEERLRAERIPQDEAFLDALDPSRVERRKAAQEEERLGKVRVRARAARVAPKPADDRTFTYQPQRFTFRPLTFDDFNGGNVRRGRVPAFRVRFDIAQAFGLKDADLTGRGRETQFVEARSVFVKLMRERGLSFPMIGRLLGNRDHSTIINLHNKFEIYHTRSPFVQAAYLAFKEADEALDG